MGKKTVIIYLIAINIITFVVYICDKRKAQKNKWRVKESTLLLLAASGGSIGALLAMYGFRHKTKHPKFFIGVPLILLLQAGLIFYVYSNFR